MYKKNYTFINYFCNFSSGYISIILVINLVMNYTKHSFTAFIFYLFSLSASYQCFAQLEMSAFTATGRGGAATTFATDYQCIGVNPANLGVRRSFRDPALTLGFMEFNASFFSEGLSRGELAQTIFDPTATNFSYSEKQKAVEKFTDKANSINIDFMLVGAALHIPKVGGFAFAMKDRFQFYAKLNGASANLLFLGQNSNYFTDLEQYDPRTGVVTRIKNDANVTQEQRDRTVAGFIPEKDAKTYGEILNGSRFSMSWYREFNFSYGTKVVDTYNFSAHVGVGVKYLRGIALIDVIAENGQLTRDNISLSPTLGITGLEDAPKNGTTFQGFTDGASQFSKLLTPQGVGNGFAMDFGVNFVIKRNWYIGAAVTNIGSIEWSGNTYKLQNDKLQAIEGTGLNGYNILATSSNTFRLAGNSAALKLAGSPSITEQLPSVVRIGTSYEYFRTFHLGLDVIIPRNNVSGNLQQTLVTLGGEYRLTRFVRISTGLSIGGNQSRINVPAGIVFSLRKRWLETGIATRDLLSYIYNSESGGNTLSFSAGFLRFKLF